ncbi:MAG TPA: DUF6134 family protein [Flavisolibacter sp.]|jgi:hypothetical protein|nr:DUF6134 family protein [Flavisolibacter sp.]
MNRLSSLFNPNTYTLTGKAEVAIRSSIKRAGLLTLLLVNVMHLARAQEQNLLYAIHRNGDKVGDLTYRQVTEGTKTTFSIQSVVKVSMLLTFTVQAWEESVYQNNVLQFSSLVRKVNGRERTNRQIRNAGNNKVTITNKNNARQEKNYVINYNTLRLYATEPLSISSVFSDNYQQFLSIEKLATHHYRIKFPDGGSNEYFYRDGLCRRVKVSSTLFDAEFILLNH